MQLVSGHRLAPGALERRAEAVAAAAGDGSRACCCRSAGSAAGACAASISTVHAGEIVGVAGLLGSGSEDLPYVLFGALPGVRGTIRLGEFSGELATLDPSSAQRLGIALVPADRKQQGAASALSVEKNMLSLVLPGFVRRGVLSHGRLRAVARERAETYDVRPRDPAADMAALSGGNQQKVVLARWLELNPRLLLLHEPTQGVDVATRAEIYAIMRARCAPGGRNRLGEHRLRRAGHGGPSDRRVRGRADRRRGASRRSSGTGSPVRSTPPPRAVESVR